MFNKLKKIISLLVCFFLLFEQSSFAQPVPSAVEGVAAELDIARHLLNLHNSLVQDKFRPLHLRYLSYDTLNNNFKLLLDKGDFEKGLSPSSTEGTVPDTSLTSSPKGTVPKANLTLPEARLKEETKNLLNYFFIGLTLPNDTFWVNLRPDSPDNIIDNSLAQTDVGRIMLETDLQLKKDTAKFTSPQTPEGKEYWDKLYQKAGELFGSENITIPTLTRPWIVPDEIIIRETPGDQGLSPSFGSAQDSLWSQGTVPEFPSAYIYKATLKVMLEEDYLRGMRDEGRGTSVDYSFKDPRLKELNAYSSQLIRELIIPKLTKEVNSSKRYASLRQVYYSLILAQWFKARFNKQGTATEGSPERSRGIPALVDSQNLTNLTSKQPWDKTTYFKAYQKSFKQGEYSIQEPAYTSYGQTIRSYFSGGISGLAPEIPVFGSSPVTDSKTGAKITALPSGSSPMITNGKNVAMTIPATPVGQELSPKGTDPDSDVQVASPAKGGASSPMQNKTGSSPVSFTNTARKTRLLLNFLRVIGGFNQAIKIIRDIGNTEQEIREYLIRADEWHLSDEVRRQRIRDIQRSLPKKVWGLIKYLAEMDQKGVTLDRQRETIEFIRKRPWEVFDLYRDLHFASSDKLREMVQDPTREARFRQQVKERRAMMLKAFKEGRFDKSVLIIEGEDSLGEKKGQAVIYIVHKINERFSVGVFVAHKWTPDMTFRVYKRGNKTPVGVAYPFMTNTHYRPRSYHDDFSMFLIESSEPLEPLSIVSPYERTIGTIMGVRNNNIITNELKISDRNIGTIILAGFVYDGDSGAPLVVLDDSGNFGVVGHISGYDFLSVYADLFNSTTIKEFRRILEGKEGYLYQKLEPGFAKLRDVFPLPRDSFLPAQGSSASPVEPQDPRASSPLSDEDRRSTGSPQGDEQINRVLDEIQRRREEIQRLVDASDNLYFKVRNSYIVSDYILRLELLHLLGVLQGIVLYPSIGNDYFPSYFSRTTFGINSPDASGLGVNTKNNTQSLEVEAIRRGLPENFRERQKPLQIITSNNFETESYFSQILQVGKVDTVIIKGLTHWSYYYSHLVPEERAGVEDAIRSLIKKIDDKLLKEGGFIVIASEDDLWLTDFIIKELGYSDLLMKPENKRIQDVLSVKKDVFGYNEFDTYFGGVDSVLGAVPIRILQKPRPFKTETSSRIDANPGGIDASGISPSISSDSSLRLESMPPTTKNTGGIDFRSLPIVTQAVSNLSGMLRDSPLRGQSLLKINLDAEWRQIERLASSGITPSSERIKEYIQTSCAQGSIIQDRDKILLCISDILRQEEQRCASTDGLLKDIMVVLEAGSSAQELKEIFLARVI